MQKVAQKSGSLLVAIAAILLFCFSGQQGDLRHSSTYVNGLIDHGLSYYTLANSIGCNSNYLPGLYLLLGIAISPALLISRIFGADACGISTASGCLAESLCLKIAIVLLAAASCWLIKLTINVTDPHSGSRGYIEEANKGLLRQAVGLLFFPPVLYSWLFFGAYDGLGAFSAILGSLLFLRRQDLSNRLRVRSSYLAVIGLVLASLAVSAKLFPVVMVLGICYGFSLNRRDALACLMVPVAVAALQIAAVASLGALPLSIASDKLKQQGPFLYSQGTAVILILLCIFVLIKRHQKVLPAYGLGLFAASCIFALAFPSFRWHPQWQIYYGICFYGAVSFLVKSKRIRHWLEAVLLIQSASFALATQWWAGNADISMTLSGWNRLTVPPFQNLLSSYGLQPLAILDPAWAVYSLTLIISVALVGIELEAQKGRKVKSKGGLMANQGYVNRAGIAFFVIWLTMAILSSTAPTKSADAGSPIFIESTKIQTLTANDGSTGGYILDDGSEYKFLLEGKSKTPLTIEHGLITIGNNFGRSAGRLEICLLKKLNPGTTGRDGDEVGQCTIIPLRNTKDNSPSLFWFSNPEPQSWTAILIRTHLRQSSPLPVLYTRNTGRPLISLYSRKPINHTFAKPTKHGRCD